MCIRDSGLALFTFKRGRSTNGELKIRASGVKRGRSLDAHRII